MSENIEQGRNADILEATINNTEYTEPAQSRIEELLLELKQVIEESGGGDVTKDYVDSQVALKVDKVTGKGLSTNDYTNSEKQKLAGLENYDDTALQSAVSGKLNESDVQTSLNTSSYPPTTKLVKNLFEGLTRQGIAKIVNLTSGNWSSNMQTVTITRSKNTILPVPGDMTQYANVLRYGITLNSISGSGTSWSLTFKCTTVPSGTIVYTIYELY